MKRYIAAALAAVSLLNLTGCGRTVQRLRAETEQTSQSAETVSETKKKDKTPAKKQDNPSAGVSDMQGEPIRDVPEDIVFISDEAVETPINQLFQAIDVSDGDTVANRLFPSAFVEAINETETLDFMLRSAGVTADGSALSFSEIGLISERTAENGETELIGKILSRYMSAFDLMKANGLTYNMLNNPTGNEALRSINDQLTALLDFNGIESAGVNITVPIAEVKYVTVSLDGRKAEFPVYRPEGEDWKIDLICISAMRYIERTNN